MSLVLASAHLNDEEFLAAFHGCQLSGSEFRHADHLRLAWLHLHREPLEMALRSVREGIQKFARHHKATGLYHETLTTAWVRLLSTHEEAEFDDFLIANEHRLNKELLHRFWTPELLASDEAKRQWVPPDRCALPV
jgi:N-formylglutamate deformylase